MDPIAPSFMKFKHSKYACIADMRAHLFRLLKNKTQTNENPTNKRNHLPIKLN